MKCAYCEGQHFDLRKRVLGNGGVQFVQQCMTCGRAGSQPMSRASLGSRADKLHLFDEALIKQWEERGTAKRTAEKKAEKDAWLKEHGAYLRTGQWRSLRDAVMARSRSLCEGCGLARATQVHHLTYEHWRQEFLWELVAVCDDCHNRVHGQDNHFS